MTLPTSNIIAAADYRGIRIVVQSKPSLTYGTEYIASAGERTFLAASISTPAQAMNEAERRIDEAHDHAPERIALWRNDSEHWLAAQRATAGNLIVEARKRQVAEAAKVRVEIEALVVIRERLIALYAQAEGNKDLAGRLHNALYDTRMAITHLRAARDLITEGRG